MSVKAKHTCSVCGKIDIWGPMWAWFSSHEDLDNGRPIIKTCSVACRKVYDVTQ